MLSVVIVGSHTFGGREFESFQGVEREVIEA